MHGLARQLGGVGPEVIAVEHREILAASPRDQLGEDGLAACSQVLLGKERSNQLRVRLGVGRDHRSRPVGGGVIAHEDLECHVGLCERAVQRAGDVALVLERRGPGCLL